MVPRIETEIIVNHSPAHALTLLAFLLLLSTLDSVAQTRPDGVQSPLPPGLQIRIEATPKVAHVGDHIRIDLDLTMPAGCRAEILKPEKQIGEFFISEFFPGPALPESGKGQETAGPGTPGDQGLVHHQARILAAVYRTGSFTFPPLQIRFKTAEGNLIAASSPPVEIEIHSVLSNRDRDLRDLKKQAEIPEPVRWLLWLSILAALAILGISGWLFWKKGRNRGRPIPETPPQDLLDAAESDLRELLARGLPEGATVKYFYIRLSEIAKRILEAGYGISAAERTTSEIMESLSSQPGRKPEDMERIESFLLRCDIVKFAKYIPSRAEHEDAGKDALQILKMVRELVARRQLPVSPGIAGVSPDAA